MKAISRSALQHLLLVAACAGSFACSAEGSIPDITVTESDLAFEAMPIAGLNASLTTRFDHPGDLELPEFLNPSLHVVGVTITAAEGVSDLSFVDGLTVTLGAASPDAPPAEEMGTYERKTGQTSMRVLNLDADEKVDVVEHWRTGQAYYELTLWGSLPDRPWAVDVSVQFNGKIEIAP
jgi:hypothetical protein